MRLAGCLLVHDVDIGTFLVFNTCESTSLITHFCISEACTVNPLRPEGRKEAPLSSGVPAFSHLYRAASPAAHRRLSRLACQRTGGLR